MNPENRKTTTLAAAPMLPSVAVQEAAADAEGVRHRQPRFFDLARLRIGLAARSAAR